ncbi:MAG: nicotinate-nucleotide adenylyltransferase [Acetobacteraceae bacterium]|nr:nicotinate-nucleotide adenylyltransferase [Acetobacteraceae bacterium]
MTRGGPRDPVPRFGDRRRTRIGLLGGSFNPAHAGHRHIALIARRRLRLHQIWLLVSPQNPLKSASGMGLFYERLRSAQAIADGRRIVATGIEAALGTRFTADTVRKLRRRFSRVRFVWLIGADNLRQLAEWRQWTQITRDATLAVLPRPGYNYAALRGAAAIRLAHARRPARQAPILASRPAPAWTFIPAAQHSASATAIRQEAKEHSHRQKPVTARAARRLAAD